MRDEQRRRNRQTGPSLLKCADIGGAPADDLSTGSTFVARHSSTYGSDAHLRFRRFGLRPRRIGHALLTSRNTSALPRQVDGVSSRLIDQGNEFDDALVTSSFALCLDALHTAALNFAKGQRRHALRAALMRVVICWRMPVLFLIVGD